MTPNRQTAYKRAARHSAFVKVLKVAVPVLALSTMAAIGGLWYFTSGGPVPGLPGNVEVAGNAIQDGKLVMANPKMTGVTNDNRPYRFEALRAAQPVTGNGGIELETLTASMTLEDGREAKLTAKSGLFSQEENTLALPDASEIRMSDGTVMTFSNADVDIGSGNFVTQQPVVITLPRGRISADTMRAEDGGKRLVFERKVRVTIEPETNTASTGEQASSGN